MEEPRYDLSICMVTYNHEKYIAQAIESVLMQETTYTIEFLIIDDYSTDGTQDIIQKYAKDNPKKINAIFLKENTYRTENNASRRVRDKAMGKFIILIEGDDFWVDSHKIQKQMDFLASHDDYLAVAHRCVVVDENSSLTDEEYPDCRSTEYTLRDWYKDILPGQTATIMSVNPKFRKDIDWSLKNKGLIPGDRLSAYVLALNGKVYCIQEDMSAYRHVTAGGSSFSANNKYIYPKEEKWYGALVEYTYINGNKMQILYAETLYFENIVRGFVKGRQVSIREIFAPKYRRSGIMKIAFNFMGTRLLKTRK